MNKTILRAALAVFVLLLFCGAAVGAVGADNPLPQDGGSLASGDYYLENDLQLAANLSISGACTIDLRGHVLKGTGNGSVITVASGGNLTLKDTHTAADKHYFTYKSDAKWEETTTTTGAQPISAFDRSTAQSGSSIYYVEGGCITGGTGANGGGVLVEKNGSLTLSGGNIVGNKSTATTGHNGGGGVYVSGGSFTMNGGSIAGNYEEYDNYGGGGVHVIDQGVNGTFTMNGGSIIGNAAKHDGGGVFVDTVSKSTGKPFGKFIMNGGRITGNAARMGGGVEAWSGEFEMTGGSIEGNTSLSSNNSGGGGVYVNNACPFTMSGSANIQGNTANWDGGGVFVNGEFNMNGGSIEGNTAKGTSWGGGGVCLWGGTFWMTDGSITENKTSKNGGGVFVNSTFIMNDGTISGNEAAGNGGAVDVGSGSGGAITFTMTNGRMTGNKATGNGGGVNVPSHGTFNVSGTSFIKDNLKNSGANNVYLEKDTGLHLLSALTGQAEVHITFAGADPESGRKFGTAAQGISTEGAAASFVADVATEAAPLIGNINGSGELVWKQGTPPKPILKVTYDANGDDGTGSVPVDSASYSNGDTVTVLGNTGGLKKDNCDFSGWTLDQGGAGFVYRAGDTFTITEDTILYAKWTEIPLGSVTITFNANGGSGTMSDQHVTPGEPVSLPPNEFTHTGCWGFAGWATTLEKAQAGSVDYRNCQSVTFREGEIPDDKKVPLYAVWKEEHSTENSPHVDPTCTAPGHTISEVCSVCSKVIVKSIELPATGHNRGDPVKKNYHEPTADQDGSYDLVFSCTNCGAELERRHVTIVKTSDPRWHVTYCGSGADSGAPPVDSEEYQTGATVTVQGCGTLQKTGYTFGGWKDGTGKVYPEEGPLTVTEDTALYAVWKPDEYTIHFNANGGEGTMAPQDFTYQDDRETLHTNTFTRDGYVFAGWAPNTNVGVKYGNWARLLHLTSHPEGNIVNLYAVWNPETQLELVKSVTTDESSGSTTITKTDGGTITKTGDKTAEITTQDTTTRDETKVTLRYDPSSSDPTTDGTTITGKISSFDISYKAFVVPPPTESQTMDETATVEIEYNLQNLPDTIIDLLKETPEIIAGVNTDKLDRLSSTYKVGGMISGNASEILNNELRRTGMTLTFYLNRDWVEKRYGKDFEVIRKSLNVFHIPDNATEGSMSIDCDVTYDNGKYVVQAYTYKGISTSYAVTADPIYYEVTLNPNGGKWSEGGSDERKVTILENTPLAEKNRSVPEYTGKEFEYWCTSSGDKFDMASPVTGDIILYAKWKGDEPRPTLTVTYDKNGGTGEVPAGPSPYHAGSEVTVLGNTGGLAREGFNFSGWTISKDGTGTVYHKGDTFTITKNTTLYAKWTEIPLGSVTITFNANGGQPETYTQHVTPNTSVPLAPNEFTAPTDKPCQVFAGWATTLERARAGSVDYGNYGSVKINEEDVFLYAVWKTEHSIVNIDQVDPTCTTAGTSVGEECSVCYEIIIKPEKLPATGHNPGNPVKENYTAPTETTAGSYDLVVHCTVCGATLSSTHVTIPKITKDTRWTVTYYGNGADKGTPPVDSTKYPHEAMVTVKDKGTLQKTGYTFGGWIDRTGKVYPEGGPLTVTEDTALYAVWNPNKYTIHFNATEGTGAMADLPFTYSDQKIENISNTFTRTGYDFAGWAPSTDVGVKYGDWAWPLQLITHADAKNVINLYAVWNPVKQLELVRSTHEDDGKTELITDGNAKITEGNSAEITVDETTVKLRYNGDPTVSPGEVTGYKVTGKITNFDIHYKTSVDLPPTESQTTEETATAEIKYDLYNLINTAFLTKAKNPEIIAGVNTKKLDSLSSTYKIGGMISGTADALLNNELTHTGVTLTFYLNKDWVEKRYGTDLEEIKTHFNVLHIPDNDKEGSVSIDCDVTYENGTYVVQALTYKGFSSYAVCADPIYYQVTFDPNGGRWASGGSGIRNVNILENTPLAEKDLIVPVKDGDTFICWRTESGDEYDPALPVTGNIKLYAKWERGDPTPTPAPITPSGSSTWIQIPDTVPGDNTVSTDVTYQYTGQQFIPVSAANLDRISAADPAAAAMVEAALQTAAADGIPLTNSKGAKAIVNTTESVPGAQTETFTQIIDVTSADGSKVTSVPFTVRLSDLTVKNLTTDDVTLYHFLEAYGIWIPLETRLVSTDSTYAYYAAATDGASPFGVLLKKLDVPEVKPLPTQAGKTPVPFAGVLAALGAAGVVFGLRRK